MQGHPLGMTATVIEKVREQVRFGMLDRSVQLLAQGYDFWEHRRREGASEVVRARLMGRRTTCLRGEDAARFFYASPGLRRKGALPPTVVTSLFGRGAVHTLDGAVHGHRKHGFTTLLDHAAAFAVADGVARRWDAAAPGWAGTVDLFWEVARMQLGAVCAWAGVEVDDLDARTADMIALIDGFGSVGRRQLRAQTARRRAQRWMLPQVRAARERSADTPLAQVARWRDAEGTLLPLPVASVEALNVVRPTVAVAWFAAATARAYSRDPRTRTAVLAGDLDPMHVAQEIRRHDPFAPFLGAVATEDLDFEGHAIPRGTLVVLDLWGTDHDPASWAEPDAFRPERFDGREVRPYALVPQGGGDRTQGHRCPGEDVTLACLVALVPRIAERVEAVPAGPPSMRRMPPEPRCEVRVRADADADARMIDRWPAPDGVSGSPKTEPEGDDPVTDPRTDPRTNPGSPRPNEPHPEEPNEPGLAPGEDDDERNA